MANKALNILGSDNVSHVWSHCHNSFQTRGSPGFQMSVLRFFFTTHYLSQISNTCLTIRNLNHHCGLHLHQPISTSSLRRRPYTCQDFFGTLRTLKSTDHHDMNHRGCPEGTHKLVTRSNTDKNNTYQGWSMSLGSPWSHTSHLAPKRGR